MHDSLFLKKIYLFLFCLALSGAAVSAQQVPYEVVTNNGQTFYKYTVKPGEGVYAVARNFSVSVADILRHNPGASSGLQNGQYLLIPVRGNSQLVNTTVPMPGSVRQGPVENQNKTFKHTVVRGETVFSLSQMYHTSVEEIYNLNPGSKEGIAEGQVITIPQRRVISEEKEENYRYHTILPQETLYSLARTYSLSAEDILRANPGLSVQTFRIGKTIRIPFFESYETVVPYHDQDTTLRHKVERRETLYSISRQYNLSEEDIRQANNGLEQGLKTGMDLVIPVKKGALRNGSTVQAESQANRLLVPPRPSKVNRMKVALLLPFLEKNNDNRHLRFQEYYEGFLLAVEKMKEEGADIELYVFDIGTESDTRKLTSLLETLEMQSLHLMIGGFSDNQIKILSDFSKAHNIKYVVPLSRSNEVLNNGMIFQVNFQPSYNYTKASHVFMQTYPAAKVLFAAGEKDDKADFISQLQSDLKADKRSFVKVDGSNLETAFLAQLDPAKDNVVVPASGDSPSLKRMVEALKKIKETHPSYTVRLFGYPEWQTYDEELVKDYHLFDTQIFSSFYVNEQDPATRDFMQSFKKWYDRDLLNTYPKYGLLGYDTGLFFLTALARYGVNFEQSVDQIRVNTLQFPFYFERVNNWGGFINTGLYLIHYDTSNSITKTDKSR
ncbi:LysM peptidoglycan-binding domain-containing protein [Limibacterium fermenti]|uniref:LysM peptidoglycan-binding domain-containing protein n=1 Tax=Limibacterium fermenti TaxID=3229863 RepID=UPI000E94F372|nr:peptidoglycan-binding protein LysM [Porphyromonadaceae bacterium]